MSGENILKSSLSLGSVLALLSAGAVGVWTCANTLNDIKNNASLTNQQLVQTKEELSEKLDYHSKAIVTIQEQVADVSMQEHDTQVTLKELKEQMDRNNAAAIRRGD